MFKKLLKIWNSKFSGKVKNNEAYINGLKFILPQNFLDKPQEGQASELWMIDLFRNYLEVGPGSFVDVGVNIGQTLLKLRSVYDNMDYIGFEPNPFCVAYLHELITLNSLSNVKIIPVGVGIEDRVCKIYSYSDKFDSSATIVKNYRPANPVLKKFFIPVLNLETIRKNVQIEQVSVIKIDVEGSELEVLKSFKEVIVEYSPLILIEILPTYTAENERNITLWEILKIVDELKYEIYRIIKSSDSIMELRKLQTIEVHDRLDWSDYVLKPMHIKMRKGF